jgi:hypothetical protein
MSLCITFYINSKFKLCSNLTSSVCSNKSHSKENKICVWQNTHTKFFKFYKLLLLDMMKIVENMNNFLPYSMTRSLARDLRVRFKKTGQSGNHFVKMSSRQYAYLKIYIPVHIFNLISTLTSPLYGFKFSCMNMVLITWSPRSYSQCKSIGLWK